VNFCVFYFFKFIGKLTTFFEVSGVQFPQHNWGQFHYLCVVFSSQFKSEIGNILTKTEALRNTVNIDGTPLESKITHSPITLSNLSSMNLVSIFRCSSPPHNTVYVSRVVSSSLSFSLTSYWHSYIKNTNTSIQVLGLRNRSKRMSSSPLMSLWDPVRMSRFGGEYFKGYNDHRSCWS
jgi:hypothetical protein